MKNLKPNNRKLKTVAEKLIEKFHNKECSICGAEMIIRREANRVSAAWEEEYGICNYCVAGGHYRDDEPDKDDE